MLCEKFLNRSRAIFYDVIDFFAGERISVVFLWRCESVSNMSSVNVYFFENGEKISPFSKISGYVWKEPKFDFHFKLHLLSASFASLIPVFAFLLTDTYK